MSYAGKHRCPNHDYSSVCNYHVTLMKRAGIPKFGYLKGNIRIQPGHPGAVRTVAYPIGAIIRDALYDTAKALTPFRVYQWSLMPDHLHIIVRIEQPGIISLSDAITQFKILVNQRVRERIYNGNPISTVGDTADGTGVFSPGFNDQILRRDRDLNTVFNYLRANPWRLAVRMHYRDYFNRCSNITITGQSFTAYGNLQLLRSPFKSSVIIHRRDTPQERAAHHNAWLYTAANGGVLVSPFISKDEKEIRTAALADNGRIIKLQHEPIGPRFKPDKSEFDLCIAGRMLILTPTDLPREWTFDPIQRPCALKLNELATLIATT